MTGIKYLYSDTDSRITPEMVENFNAKICEGNLGPIDIECLYMYLSSQGQDEFLDTVVKDLRANGMSEKECNDIIIHFKALTVLDPARERAVRIKEELCTNLYDEFRK